MSNLDLKDDEHEDGKDLITEDALTASPAPIADEGRSDEAKVQDARVEHTQPPAATTHGAESTHASTPSPSLTPELAQSGLSEAQRSLISQVRFMDRSRTVPAKGNPHGTGPPVVYRAPKVRSRRATPPTAPTASHTAQAATDSASGSTTPPALNDGSEA